MNNPVLSLLLDVNGAISRKTYCVAVVLLLVLVGLAESATYFDLFSNTFLYANFPSTDVHAHILAEGLAWAFTPVFIPTYFLVFYSAVVVTLKRSRALKLSTPVTVLLVLVNTFFFNIFLKSRPVIDYLYISASDAEMSLIPPVLIIFFLFAFIVIGLSVNLYFMFSRQGEDDDNVIKNQVNGDASKEGAYNQFRYILFIGKLMLINMVIMLIFIVLAFIFRDALNDIVRDRGAVMSFVVFCVFYFGVFFGLYMHATAKRLNDAGYRTYLLVLYFIFIVFLSGLLVYFISLKAPFSLAVLSVSGAFIAVVSAIHVIPFLLKSKYEGLG